MAFPARTGMVTLCDRDLGDFGFTLSRAPNLLGTWTQSHPAGALAGGAGQLALSSEATFEPTTIPLEVVYRGESRAELAMAIDALASWCSLGPLELASAYDWTKRALVQFGGPTFFVPGKEFARTVLKGTLLFTKRCPYLFDRYARRVVSNGTGTANRVEVETGTAPSHAVVWLLDSTAATVTQRAADGTVVRQSTLTTVQGPNDALLFDGARRRVVAYQGGIEVHVPRDLTLGHGFVTLEPRYAEREAGRWQTLETSSGRLVVDFVRGWLR